MRIIKDNTYSKAYDILTIY